MSEKIPYEQVMGRMRLDIDYIAEEAYQKGYDEAKLIYQNPNAESDYQRGLNDAWDVARKALSYNDYQRDVIFDTDNIYYIMTQFTVSEAIAKIREYKGRKKADPEIKVGDEVIATNGKAVVYGLFTGNDKTLGCRYMYSDGTIGWNSATTLTKTGHHFPQIAEVLKAMKEVSE